MNFKNNQLNPLTYSNNNGIKQIPYIENEELTRKQRENIKLMKQINLQEYNDLFVSKKKTEKKVKQ